MRQFRRESLPLRQYAAWLATPLKRKKLSVVGVSSDRVMYDTLYGSRYGIPFDRVDADQFENRKDLLGQVRLAVKSVDFIPLGPTLFSKLYSQRIGLYPGNSSLRCLANLLSLCC